MPSQFKTFIDSSTAMYEDDNEFTDEFDNIKSKSQIKREAEALKDLGEKLIKLKVSDLEKVPLEDKLRAAILEAQRITANGAIRRQRQYIGKLMRDADHEAIQAAYNKIMMIDKEHVAHFHLLERLRDRLVEHGDTVLDEVIEHLPHADLGQIRQLTRNARNELKKGDAPKSARKLFKYLRSLSEHAEHAEHEGDGEDSAED